MPSELELMHGWDEIVLHDFAPAYYCGICGSPMKQGKGKFECPNCSMRFGQKSDFL